MADSEQLGFEHMGLDPRLLQVLRGLRIRAGVAGGSGDAAGSEARPAWLAATAELCAA